MSRSLITRANDAEEAAEDAHAAWVDHLLVEATRPRAGLNRRDLLAAAVTPTEDEED